MLYWVIIEIIIKENFLFVWVSNIGLKTFVIKKRFTLF